MLTFSASTVLHWKMFCFENQINIDDKHGHAFVAEDMQPTLNAICGLACFTHKAQRKVMKTNSESEIVKLQKRNLQAVGQSSNLNPIQQKSYECLNV